MKEILLFFLALVGSLLILFSFLSVEVRNVDFKMLGIGSLMILSVMGYGIWTALAPPDSVAASLKETLDEAIYAYDYPSWPIAKELAQCSSDAYLPPVDAEETLTKRGYNRIASLNSSTMVGYVAFLDDAAVIVFRGTNPAEIQDWYINLNNRSQKTDHGNVHAGFWNGYDSLHSQLIKILESRKPERILWRYRK
ncbi:MAG: hypothetical protein ACKN82_06900 [Pirellula sp.]